MSLEQDDLSSNRHPALSPCLSMSFFAKSPTLYPSPLAGEGRVGDAGPAPELALRCGGSRRDNAVALCLVSVARGSAGVELGAAADAFLPWSSGGITHPAGDRGGLRRLTQAE